MKKRISMFPTATLVLGAMFAASGPLAAASLIWDANAATAGQPDGSGGWLDVSQWQSGTTNVSWSSATPDDATIGNGGTGGTITTGAVITGGLAFNSFNGTYLLGAGSLKINAGGISKNLGSGPVTVVSSIELGAPQSWLNNSATLLSVNSTVAMGANALTIDGTGSTTLAAANMLTGGASSTLVKNGSGILNLAGSITSGTHTGGVTLNAGTLNISGVGGASGVVTTALGSGIFTINGGTFNNTSGVDLTSPLNNAQTWGGNFAFTGTNSLNMGSGAITLTGNRTGTVNANTLTVGGIIGDGGSGFGITKAGAGTLTLTGNNTYTGVVNVDAGFLRATSSANALGTGAATVVLAGGQLQLASSTADLSFNRNTTVTANSQVTADTTVGFGNNDSRANTFTMGTLAVGAQTLTVASGANVLSIQNGTGNSGITFGATNLTGNATFNILNPSVAPSFRTAFGAPRDLVTLLTLGAVTDGGNTATLIGNGNFAQTGVWGGSGGITLGSGYTGTATLSQTNTFTGAVTVNGGTLVANTLANGGAPSHLGASSNAATNLVLGGGTLQTTSTAAIDRNFTLTNGTTSTINNSTTANTLTITGSAVASTGSLIKAGTGGLNLAGTNLYTGATSVNSGNLTLGFSNLLAPVSNILAPGSSLVMGGGTLTLTGKAATANSQTFTGTTLNRGASSITATSGGGGGDSMTVTLGPIVRTVGQNGTANFSKPTLGNLTTSTANDATGILGPWATFSGTDYARNDGAGNIVALAMIDSLESTWTSSTGNYTLAGSTVLTGSRSINTLRYTGPANTLSLGGAASNFDLTTKGILNGGSNVLTISRGDPTATGVVRIAAGTEFVAGGAGGSANLNIDAPLVMESGSVLTKATGFQFQTRGGLITLGNATLINNTGNFNVTTGGTTTTSAATLGGNLTLVGTAAIGFNSSGFDLNNGNRTIFANGTATQTIAATINNTGGSAGQKLTIGGSGLVTIGALTSGTNSPGLEINGTGVYNFSVANTFAGGVTLTAGTYSLSNNITALGVGAVTAKGGTITGNSGGSGFGTFTNGFIFDGGNGTPINFTTTVEGFTRNMSFSGATTVQSAPTLNFTNAHGNSNAGARSFSGPMALDSNLTLTGTHTGNVDFSGGVTFAGNRTITFNDNGNTTIRGALTGGVNTLTLAGTNQRVVFGDGTVPPVTGATGGVIVSGGLVSFNNSNNAFSGGVTLTGGTIMLSGATAGAITNGPVGTGTLTLKGGSIGNTGSGPVIANALVLDGVNNTPINFVPGTDFLRAATYSGTTTIENSPTLNFTVAPGDGSNNGSRTFSGAKTLNSNLTLTGNHLASVFFTNGFDLGGSDRTITFNDNGVTSLAGTLAGAPSTLTLAGSNSKAVIAGLTGATAHALTVNGLANSLFTMNAASTYTGATTVTGGTLAYNVSNAIATGDVSVTGVTAVLDLGTDRSDSVGIVTLDNSGKITGNGTSTLTSTGSFEMKSGSVSASLGGGVALNKTTGGLVALSGPSSYSGGTSVSAGTLLVNNVTGSGTGTGAVSVTGGASLGGSGTISNTATLDDGAKLTFNLSTNGAGHDALVLGGLVNSGTTTVVITSSGGASPGTYVLATTGGVSGAGTINPTPVLPGGWMGTVAVVGNNVELNLASTGGGSTPYDTWAAGPFANPFTNTAPGVDFDNDGLKNLLEFVLGGDPTISQPGIAPTVTASGTDLVITFKRSDASELQPVAVKVQVSADLVTWNPASDIPIAPGNVGNPGPIGASNASYTLTNSAGFDTVIVTIPKAAATKKFARVVATD